MKCFLGITSCEVGAIADNPGDKRYEFGEASYEVGGIKSELGAIAGNLGETKNNLGDERNNLGAIKYDFGTVRGKNFLRLRNYFFIIRKRIMSIKNQNKGDQNEH